jgi:TetR/AcrR family transcriptional repressor of nem operon
MGRPRGFDVDEAADGLLQTFWRRGYARTAVPGLTEATGLLPGSLYAAFGSKEDMFRVAIDRYVTRIRHALTTERRGLDAVRHVLDAVVRLTAGDPERRGCLVLNAIPEATTLSAETRAALQAALDEMRALLRTHLREAEADAGVALDVERLDALCFGAAVAIRVLGRAGQPRRLLQAIADGATAAVREALARPPSRKDADR